MARVFLWRPSIDSETKKPLLGHISMELNKDRTYISCWPKNESKFKNLFGNEPRTQTMEQDKRSEKRDYDDYIAIPEEYLNHDKLLNWWINERPKKYSLLEYNCARCVYDALQAGAVREFWRYSIMNAFTPNNMRFLDDDDPTYEEYQNMRDNPIEEKPIQPEKAFEWIKMWVEEERNKKSGNKKCIIS